jgi:hypothetical protein
LRSQRSIPPSLSLVSSLLVSSYMDATAAIDRADG